ncbi:unnamed protein product [Ilex paraguariensis]|uniref:PCI domain-containing protein n=1 Tax=Ilex paraguariensis TaxID=185542 RepID=A0ABC8SD85_9AQUA
MKDWAPRKVPNSVMNLHPGAAFSGVHDCYWKNGAPGFRNNHLGPLQPNDQKPLDMNPTYESYQNQPKSALPQGPNTLYPATHTAPPSYQSSLQTVPHIVPPLDSQRVSKLQIPTNPRIAPSLPLGLPKTDRDNSATSAATKPAYISVSLPKPNDKVSSHDAADSILKMHLNSHVDRGGMDAITYTLLARDGAVGEWVEVRLGARNGYCFLTSRRNIAVMCSTTFIPSRFEWTKFRSSICGEVMVTLLASAWEPNRFLVVIIVPGSLSYIFHERRRKQIRTACALCVDGAANVSTGARLLGTQKVLPGMFPKSLRGYVERALARCKDDTQMVACQVALKEVITRATADGTLYTRDWDTEPLFPLPNLDGVHKDSVFSTPISSLPKNKRSPSRRSKSRWEPVPEEKPVDKTASVSQAAVNYGSWTHFNERDKQFSVRKSENKEDNFSSVKFSFSDQKTANKNAQSPRPAKRQCLGDVLNSMDNVEASSDSDKEQNLTAYYSAAIALGDSPEERKKRENRSKRFEKVRGNRADNNLFRPKNVGAGNLYARRASALVLSKNFEDSSSRAVEDIDWDALTVKGTCQEIEKRYLRLTSAPDPSTVRPEEVLEKALGMVQNSEKNYLYKCDQLKSIRQDLTVQHIRNELTVEVYETHARFAIEVGDLAEYNQCQSQLKTLYAEGIKGCHMEFSAYNLLCVILHSNNNRDLLSAMSRLSVGARQDEAVKHALAVRAAVTSGNYVLFFRLYKTAPNLNTCLMDLYVEKMRYAAVRCMSRSCRPTVPVSYIAQVLGFPTVMPTVDASGEKDTDGLEECVEWLKAHGGCLTADNSGEMVLDTKACMSSLYMPEPEDAVAHGDASLAVNDFLTKHS